ncbi:hypothetical protein NBRC110019_02450 [Neptunitalea chrysea]|uniref:Uncharacterized protein n=1 Tax=Neptunitalea chrysea TaxID=1647581 RepID=A0A9W6B2S3_9FLAO|nr:hypothetical protein [Neptunitalea chrysea]GLB51206.1 hypothetical protein NBRC110019_02450 [Neptunitalea chrysea]
MILDGVRKKIINKLRNGARDNDTVRFEFNEIKKVAILVDLDNFKNPNLLFTAFKTLALKNASLEVIGYVKKKEVEIEYVIPVYQKKEVGLIGKLKSEPLSGFVNKKYDVLINYFSEEVYELVLVSTLTKASIKVGFPTIDKNCNDLILNCDFDKTTQFFEMLKNYLKVIKK